MYISFVRVKSVSRNLLPSHVSRITTQKKFVRRRQICLTCQLFRFFGRGGTKFVRRRQNRIHSSSVKLCGVSVNGHTRTQRTKLNLYSMLCTQTYTSFFDSKLHHSFLVAIASYSYYCNGIK